jgi:hypothetical protein
MDVLAFLIMVLLLLAIDRPLGSRSLGNSKEHARSLTI